MPFRSCQACGDLFHGQRARAELRLTAATLLVVGLSSCAVTDPYVMPDSSSVSMEDFAKAEEYASGKADKLDDKLRGLHTYELATGSVLFVSTLVGMGMAAYGANPDALIGAGLAGGTAYGATDLLPIQDRKAIYEQGASTIRCAISALRPNEWSEAIDATDQAVSNLEESGDALADAYRRINTGAAGGKSAHAANRESGWAAVQDGILQSYTAMIRGQRVAQKTNEAKEEAERFVDIVRNIDNGKLADRLVAVTDGILQSVTAQVSAARLDPDGAIDALVRKTQTLTTGVHDAAEILDAKLRVAKEENEQIKKSANAKRTSAIAQAEVVTTQPANDVNEQTKAAQVEAAKKTAKEARAAADKASENIGKLNAVDDRVQRVLRRFNLEVACGGGS